MLMGEVVDKYRGNQTEGGYIVVEGTQKSVSTNDDGRILATFYTKVRNTLYVPEELYAKVNIGDKSVFPF